ncbi:hypothetical protein POM88_041309 [Heracleum sosnowskyi]|uniref:CCHC-type domain-containing protein n=1 Tax=Heracleum sosnowskyi TaxID=360622 RepID=A0AAD8MB93_9APIA|nr:hypothetical protein POM88_041309 [Heracleum sosnowskyi]
MGHYATDCEKPKDGKTSGKALVTSSKKWMDSSDSEEEEETNYALMAKVEEISEKVPETTYPFDTDNMIEIEQMLKIESLEKELKKEREQIRVWTHSGKQNHLLMNDKNWKECIGYKKNKEKEKEKVTMSTHIKFVPASEMKINSTFEEGSSSSTKIVSEEEMIDELVSDIEIDSISSEETKSHDTSISKISTETPIKIHAKVSTEYVKKSVKKEKNIGHLSSGKLNKKINVVTGIKNEKIPKRHRNGKQGIDKSNSYKYIPNAPRKTCHTCGNTNHLAIDCRKNKKRRVDIPISDVRNRKVSYKPQNPCSHCGSSWHSVYTCNSYHNLYHDNYVPLPKFNKGANFDNNLTVLSRHVYVKKNSVKSSSIESKSVEIDLKKNSAAMLDQNSMIVRS